LVTRGVADARSDVYAAGIMLFEMLAGKQPFEGEQAVQIAYQHANDNVPAPSKFNSNVPPLLDELVLWATARDAAHRPADAVELLEVVKRAKAEIKAGRNDTNLGIPVVQNPNSQQLPNATTVLPTTQDQTQVLNPDLYAASGFDENQTMALSAIGDHSATTVLDNLSFESDSFSPLEEFGRKRRGLRLLIVTLLVVLLGGGGGWWFSSGPGGLAVIPNLTSRTADDAQLALSTLKANIALAEESSATVTKGLVIRTDPPAGALFFGGTLTIYISSGPSLVAAPELKGMNVAAATAEIIKNGFTLGEVKSVFNEAPIGEVFDYLGSDGNRIPENSRINIWVSLGAIPVVAGLEQEAAVAAIELVGLKINEITEDYSDSIAAGQVISIVPQTQPLEKNGSVNLIVSKGPNIVEVPNMIGQTVLAAKAALESLGLRVIVNTDQLTTRWGVVAIKRQSAAAGTQLRVGDSITISTK
jgi:serine/threonine-protein kinase